MDDERNQQNGERVENINPAVIVGSVEPTGQENLNLFYVNVNEYASIERKQFQNITEDNVDEIQPTDDNKLVDAFLYANTEEFFKRRVSVDKLRDFVKNKTDLEYIEEFMDLPPGLIKPFNESQKTENIRKNRYKGVYPYDSRRVIVKDMESDFINASYIDGYKRQKAYIASLGPTIKQMGDDFGVFWNMVWQERVCKIVMLTNLTELGVKKCDKYWPDKDVCCTYGDVKVTGKSEEIYPCFTVRIFSIEKFEKRILYQMHFTAWPDKSTPKDAHTIVEFWEKVTRIPTFELGPIIVHCSAGVGRTGTFIALDILANEGVSERTVDIFACVRNLREDRVSLVQTVEQYRFLHDALVLLLDSHTSVKALLANDATVQNDSPDKISKTAE
ncbi:receptor-type tyrosine-protein phosphatase epsilon-like [Ruditapes philippinarum]|uniref:receptor-type tyrosine-protein phosphatase epsilon-like n=1 Tax=Ruditapes philippinarum TaxID=129788 RepID=UPI00295B329D|nr:receptor-type tyrosine-protein phosphatase epsilon-like [Ruditapes philippinarum]